MTAFMLSPTGIQQNETLAIAYSPNLNSVGFTTRLTPRTT